VTHVDGVLTVGKAELTVTADNQEKFCGQTIIFTGTEYSQFILINGDSITSATISSTGAGAGAGTNSSPYSIIITDALGIGLGNYNITYVSGLLTVKGVTLDVTNAQSPRSINDDVIITIKVTYGGNVIEGSLVTLKVGDNTLTSTSSNLGIATFNFGKLSSGLYSVIAQAGGCTITEPVFLPVYDPNGGFVTGGGWIDSPAGASKLYPAATGKANFGFNAKYKTGKNNTNEVDGNTNFQFKAGDLHFSSSVHHSMSLVISGAKATYTGEGTINGSGSYEFRLIAIDGDLLGNSTDKFRIKIWTKGNPSDVIYDNQRGVSESSDDATVLGGGSIVIHKPKGKTSTKVSQLDEVNLEPIEFNVSAYPNPSADYFTLKLQGMLNEDMQKVEVKVFDLLGRQVYSKQGNAQDSYEFGQQFQVGVYLVTVKQGNNTASLKVIKK
jgi:hypothetical protein